MIVLMEALVASLDLRWRRGGIHVGILKEGWAVYPYAVIGRLTGGRAHIDFERAPTARIRDGDGYLIPPGTRYHFVPPSNHPCTYRWMHLDVRVLQTVDLFSLISAPAQLAQGQRIGEIAEALSLAQRMQDALRREVVHRRLGYELLDLVLAQSVVDGEALHRVTAIERLQPVLTRMHASLDQPIHRATLARIVGLSPTRFHAVFAASMGCAPVRYLLRLRIARAQQLLLASDASVAEVGRACGMPDPFHFSKVFRRAVGESPRQYRQRSLRSMSS